jgi:hypothetical protein
MILKHHCDNCDSKYKIIYDEDDCEDSPTYCPFCAEYLIVNKEYQNEDI